MDIPAPAYAEAICERRTTFALQAGNVSAPDRQRGRRHSCRSQPELLTAGSACRRGSERGVCCRSCEEESEHDKSRDQLPRPSMDRFPGERIRGQGVRGTPRDVLAARGHDVAPALRNSRCPPRPRMAQAEPKMDRLIRVVTALLSAATSRLCLLVSRNRAFAQPDP